MVEEDEMDKMYKKIADCVLDVAIYVRVSTSSQTTENQIIELAEVCERNKWNIVYKNGVYISDQWGLS
jgi:hypothetical protein